jgi:hypothetical protein
MAAYNFFNTKENPKKMVYTVLYEYSNWKKSFEMHNSGR